MIEEKTKTLFMALDKKDNLIYIIGDRGPIAVEVCSMPEEKVRVAIRLDKGYEVKKSIELTAQEITKLENQLH